MKVEVVKKRLKERVYLTLLRYKGEGKINIGKTEIHIAINPKDIHKFDRPDCLLWIEISLKILKQPLKLKIPIPIEATSEERSMKDALEDLTIFVKKGRYPIEIPMLVIANKGYQTTERKEKFPVKFIIRQIPSIFLELEK